METNLSSQSKSFLVSPSTCTCVHVLYSAIQVHPDCRVTRGAYSTRPGAAVALKPSAMVRSREAWPYFLPRHSGLITCTEYHVLVYMAKGIVLGADRWIRRLYFSYSTVSYMSFLVSDRGSNAIETERGVCPECRDAYHVVGLHSLLVASGSPYLFIRYLLFLSRIMDYHGYLLTVLESGDRRD